MLYRCVSAFGVVFDVCLFCVFACDCLMACPFVVVIVVVGVVGVVMVAMVVLLLVLL